MSQQSVVFTRYLEEPNRQKQIKTWLPLGTASIKEVSGTPHVAFMTLHHASAKRRSHSDTMVFRGGYVMITKGESLASSF